MTREGTLAFGLRIEQRAEVWFLSQGGARLLERNYRTRGGEIDLVFEDGGDLVFVEVRARLPGNWTSGLESIAGKKQRRLKRAIRHFLVAYRGGAKGIRVDVLDWNGRAFTHYKNVWI